MFMNLRPQLIFHFRNFPTDLSASVFRTVIVTLCILLQATNKRYSLVDYFWLATEVQMG